MDTDWVFVKKLLEIFILVKELTRIRENKKNIFLPDKHENPPTKTVLVSQKENK